MLRSMFSNQYSLRIVQYLCLPILFLACFSFSNPAAAQESFITRRDGFLMIWQSIARPVAPTKEAPYTDVPKGAIGFDQITFAKARGILDDTISSFRPDHILTKEDALLWIYRTRSVEPIDDDGTRRLSSLADPENLVRLNEVYSVRYDSPKDPLTADQLLRSEEHTSEL